MRRLCFVWIASCLALSVCTPLLGQRVERTPPSTHKPDPEKACADWRWIGISRPETRCPDVQGWTVRPLFPQLAPVQQRSGGYCPREDEDSPEPGLIRELNRFCVYELADPKKDGKRLPAPPAAGLDLVRVDRDCASLALSEKYLEARNGNVADEVLIAQALKPETPLPISRQLGVRLAFLDTQPTGMGVPKKQGNSPHGYTLAHLSRKLVCTKVPGQPDEQCAAQITTRLALPLLAFDPKQPQSNKIAPTRGGYFGMQSHLAQAIRDEVDSWRSANQKQHLVLNLSMAWDANLFGGLNEKQIDDLRAGTQAVYRALQYAAGFDVLVLAAAGNQKREPCANYGPLLPAAWEGNAPPDERARKLEAPLLYAVAGLQNDGKYLANARPGGIPRRVAYGETPLFAGSSVATAIASSIAAVVWNSFPELSSEDVMRILDANVPENQLADAADFWFAAGTSSSQPAPKVQRLSLCTALEQACARHASKPCPFSARCRRWTRPEGPAVFAAKGSCQPWVFPQPEDNPCPACLRPPDLQ